MDTQTAACTPHGSAFHCGNHQGDQLLREKGHHGLSSQFQAMVCWSCHFGPCNKAAGHDRIVHLTARLRERKRKEVESSHNFH